MNRFALLLIAAGALPLNGCVVAAAGGSAIGGYVAGQLNSDPVTKANLVLKLDAPVKRLVCYLERGKPHSLAFWTYCENIPTNIGDALITAAKVWGAIRLEDSIRAEGKSTTSTDAPMVPPVKVPPSESSPTAPLSASPHEPQLSCGRPTNQFGLCQSS